MSSGCYVYAIQRRGTMLPADLLGFEERPLGTISHDKLEAVLSEIDRETLEASAENVLRHESVVEAVRTMGPAIPVRFGTILSSAGAVADAVRSRYAVLDADLQRLGDKVEMGLSVLWDPPTAPPAAGTESLDRSDADSRGTRYLQARLLEHRRDAHLRSGATELARAVNAKLAPFALEYLPTILPTPRLAVRVAYLMHPSRVGAFQDAFADLRRERTDVRFLVSGPWPPYSFVSTEGANGWST